MKRIGFYCNPEIVAELTREEVALLMKCSSMHYDSHCISYSRAGGLLQGLTNMLTWPEQGDKVEHRFTFRDVDTLAKITEFSNPTVDNDVRRRLNIFFGECCDAINAEYRRLNPEPTT